MAARLYHSPQNERESGFLHISRDRFDRKPIVKDLDEVRRSLVLEDGGGYDGQFMYYEAFDPFLWRFRDRPVEYRAFIDAPPYRYGRIGFVWLSKALSAGQWQWYPRTMVWLVFLSIVACAMLLGVMAADAGLTPALAALVVLIPGFWPVCLVTLDPGDRDSVRAERGRRGVRVRAAPRYRSGPDALAGRCRAVEAVRGMDAGQRLGRASFPVPSAWFRRAAQRRRDSVVDDCARAILSNPA